MLIRVLLVAILVACGGGVQGQSLEAAAAKEKERRAKIAGSAKSFTDSDLRDAASKRAREGTPPSSERRPPSVAPVGASSPVPPVGPGSTATTDATSSEESKRSRGAEYKARLAEANASLERAEAKLKAAEDYWNEANTHPSLYILDTATARLKAAKKDVELRRGERDDIEDAARREGIPPGYMR